MRFLSHIGRRAFLGTVGGVALGTGFAESVCGHGAPGLSILEPMDGAVMHARLGRPITGGLEIAVQGRAARGAEVQVVPALETVATDPRRGEIIDLLTHEQYFWPFYRNYLPDHARRMDRAIRFVTQWGYRPVFLQDGFLGGPA